MLKLELLEHTSDNLVFVDICSLENIISKFFQNAIKEINQKVSK